MICPTAAAVGMPASHQEQASTPTVQAKACVSTRRREAGPSTARYPWDGAAVITGSVLQRLVQPRGGRYRLREPRRIGCATLNPAASSRSIDFCRSSRI